MKKFTLPALLITSLALAGSMTQIAPQTHAMAKGLKSETTSLKKEVITFKDPSMKFGAELALISILGHAPSPEEFTQENLNKITEFFTSTGTVEPTTLEDLQYMPNIRSLRINYFSGDQILDSAPIGNLENLEEFYFNEGFYLGGGLNSFSSFEQNKKLRVFNYTGVTTPDSSESLLDNIPSLQTIAYQHLLTTMPNFGDLDHLPNLKSLSLNSTGLQKIPRLNASKNLDTLDLEYNNIADISGIEGKFPQLTILNLKNNELSEASAINSLPHLTNLNLGTNKLTEIPDLSNLSQLKSLTIFNNNISTYKNLDKLNLLEAPPSVDMTRNILTNNEGLLTYKGNLNVQFNFIAEYDLYKQIRTKPIGNQSINMDTPLTLPIQWEFEDGTSQIFMTDFQQAFTDTKNMSITTSNDNVEITKNIDTIVVKGVKKGTTEVSLNYRDHVGSTFTVTVQ